jgi:membrane protein
MTDKPDPAREHAGFVAATASQLGRLVMSEQNPVFFFRDIVLLFYETMREFFQRGAAARAAALTYTTLLSMIPLLGLVVVIFKQVGGFQWLMEQLQPILAEYLSPDGSQLVTQFLIMRMAELDLSTLGVFGVLTLGLGVYTLISTVETDLNNIWRVRRSRSIRQRLSSYWLLMTLLPVVAGVSIFLSGEAAVVKIFHELPEWVNEARGHFLPMAVQFGGFLFLYWAMPNTRVRLVPAVVGAAFAAGAWELAKIGFGIYTVRAHNYNVVYGSLAALPLFMIWVYLTWVIVLTGAELSFIVQNRRALLLRRKSRKDGPLPEYVVALAVRDAVLDSFEHGAELTVERLGRLLWLPEADINAVVETMAEGGLLRRAPQGEQTLVLPARPRSQLDAAAVAGLFLRDPAEFTKQERPAYLLATLGRLSARHRAMLTALTGEAPEREAAPQRHDEDAATGARGEDKA